MPEPDTTGRGRPGAPHLPGLVADGDGVTLEVTVIPGARRTGADGLHAGLLKVRLAARPIEGQANAALLDWLAGELHCPKRTLQLVAGATSRRKRVAIALPLASVAAWLVRVAGTAVAE